MGVVLGFRERAQPEPERASEIYRLYHGQQISLSEYRAGLKYQEIALSYLESIDSPGFATAEDPPSISDDAALKRKIDMAAAKEVLRGVGPRVAIVVDRVATYDEPLRPGEIVLLRSGLKALSGEF